MSVLIDKECNLNKKKAIISKHINMIHNDIKQFIKMNFKNLETKMKMTFYFQKSLMEMKKEKPMKKPIIKLD